MSTILDALRRADAERQRGQAPSREAVTRLPSPHPAPARTRAPRGLLLACGLGAVLAGGLAWTLWPQPPAPAPAAAPLPPPAEPPARPPAEPATPAEPRPAPPPSVAGAGVGFQALPYPLPVPPRPAAQPAARPPEPPAARPEPRARRAPAPAPAPAPATVSTPALPPTAQRPAAAAARPAARPLREQPAGLQAALQGQRIDGVVHAEDPGSRLLIVNGQIRHEGDSVAEGVRIERIEPGAVLLQWQGGLHALRP